MRKLIFWILLLLFATLGVVLGVMNPHPVQFNYPGGSVHWPLSVLLALAVTAGMVVTVLFASTQWMVWRWRQRRLQRKLARCEAEQVKLRQRLVTQRQEQITQSTHQSLVKPHE
ncbi:MAG TPA: LapA family protein [Piscirickettsiaceae bacterium]|nr:LapA family protein [Piscirickettsiaceae bacterium]HIQ40885.1 LapA family protein [Sulfurivirga caldicuralii]